MQLSKTKAKPQLSEPPSHPFPTAMMVRNARLCNNPVKGDTQKLVRGGKGGQRCPSMWSRINRYIIYVPASRFPCLFNHLSFSPTVQVVTALAISDSGSRSRTMNKLFLRSNNNKLYAKTVEKPQDLVEKSPEQEKVPKFTDKEIENTLKSLKKRESTWN